jgi:hypothetical protein
MAAARTEQGSRAAAPEEPPLPGREELAARQLSLVAALVAGAPAPAGIDAERVRIQAAALVRKRGRSVARRRPELAAALGSAFWAAFTAYDRARSGAPPDCSSADAREFARYLLGPLGRAYATPEVRRAARAIRRRIFSVR